MKIIIFERRGPRPVRINAGCGHERLAGHYNLDIRRVAGMDLQADTVRLPLRAESVDEAHAGSLLEHFADPCVVLDELHRVLKPGGRLVVRVPALGTNAAHLDPTHQYLADLAHWRQLLLGYFGRVGLGSRGVRHRSNRLLVALQRLLIVGLGFHDLGQCWVLTATRKRPRPGRVSSPWWAEPRPSHPPLPRARRPRPARF